MKGGGGAGVTLRLFSKEFIFSYLLSLVNSVKTVSEGTTQQFLLSSLWSSPRPSLFPAALRPSSRVSWL